MRTFLSVLVWVYWTVCIVTFLGIVSLLYVLTLPFDRFNQIPNGALRALAWIMMKPIPGWYFDIRDGKYSKITDPTIVVANHQSFLDLPLAYLLPWSMKWVAKKDMFRIPILGWIIYMTGHIGIDRQSRRSVKKLDKLVQPIKSGIPGMIFPEGTRTLDGELGNFKNGAFMLAQRYNFKVLPVVLEGGFGAMPAGSWKFNFHQTFTISVLEPLDPQDFDSLEDFKNDTYLRIDNELKALRKSRQT